MVRRIRPVLPPPAPPHVCEKCSRYYLSRQDFEDRMREREEEGDDSDCGGWTWDPPCGGCTRCQLAMASYYFDEERVKANRFIRAGFEYAEPSVIDTRAMATAGGGYSWGEYHQEWQCSMAGEKK